MEFGPLREGITYGGYKEHLIQGVVVGTHTYYGPDPLGDFYTAQVNGVWTHVWRRYSAEHLYYLERTRKEKWVKHRAMVWKRLSKVLTPIETDDGDPNLQSYYTQFKKVKFFCTTKQICVGSGYIKPHWEPVHLTYHFVKFKRGREWVNVLELK